MAISISDGLDTAVKIVEQVDDVDMLSVSDQLAEKLGQIDRRRLIDWLHYNFRRLAARQEEAVPVEFRMGGDQMREIDLAGMFLLQTTHERLEALVEADPLVAQNCL